MTNLTDPRVARVRELFVRILPLLSALGDHTRQELLLLMFEGEQKTVHQLAERLSLSRPATSHHIKVLKEAGLLTERHEGTRRYYLPALSLHVADLRELIDVAYQLDSCKEGA